MIPLVACVLPLREVAAIHTVRHSVFLRRTWLAPRHSMVAVVCFYAARSVWTLLEPLEAAVQVWAI